ncbi:winged helix-turn-helix domain-containing protein [Aquimarina sp. M1]
MKNKVKIVAAVILICIVVLSIHSFSSKEISFYPEKIKVALRRAGNQLLLNNNDSISLVLPVKEISNGAFKLSFERDIYINPEMLVAVIDEELKKAGVPKKYITELINCKTNEVSYSYEIVGPFKENEISCLGRNLPKSCYAIKVIMLDQDTTALYSTIGNLFTVSLAILLIILLSATTLFKKSSEINTPKIPYKHIKLGTLIFYPDQLKLCTENSETSLTVKECELLAIFAQYPNQIVKRELLIKQVWEDQGVVVGRSLDMFISKLRKKLGRESEIKITNVHGVGYKLEIGSKN